MMSRFVRIQMSKAEETVNSKQTETAPVVKRLIVAVDFAARAHGTQMRKTSAAADGKKLPYILHPIDAMNRLAQAGVTDVDVLMAACCHDVNEDCFNADGSRISVTQIAAVIGERAAKIVEECSDDKSASKVQRKKDQLAHAAKASLEARLVKIADKLSNASSPSPFGEVERRGYNFWTLAVVRACGDISPLYGEFMALMESQKIVYTTEAALNTELETYYKNIDASD